MKKILALVLVLCLCMSFAACGAPAAPATPDASTPDAGNETQGQTGSELAGTYDVKVWCAENLTALTEQQIADFNASNEYGIVINATVEAVGEADAATSMTTDVEAGADLFCFAQDQTARLIQAGALAPLGQGAAELVKSSHDAASVGAVTSGDALYGYPLTSDNGYFMYYDKSVITEDAVGSLEALIALCEENGRNFSFELENSWYIVSFFFATGCISEWQTDADGKFVSVNDNFNSEAGLIAAEGLQKLVTSTCYVNSSATSDFSAAVPSAIVVSGTWNYANAKEILGDNLGIAELPSFTVGENTYHLGSYNGCKLLGVKPQSDAVRAAALNQLAQYLTGEKCQMERLTNENVGWGPSNLAAQASEEFKNAPHLSALAAQNNYSRPQGQIHGAWWDIAKMIATSIKEGGELQAALDNYQASMEALFQMDDSVLNAWTVIGAIGGTNWDTDLAMTEQEDGTWKPDEAYEIADGVEFKVRQGKSWDNNYGQEFNGANVTLEWLGVEAGTYYIVFDAATGVISVVAA